MQNRHDVSRRGLRFESLEVRLALAADLPFQNPLWHLDVNDDGQHSARDLLVGAHLLRQWGTRELLAPPADDGIEGEADRMMYVDVNGDNRHDPRDLAVSAQELLVGEGPQVQVMMDLLDSDGNLLASPVQVGDTIGVRVAIQDVRNPNDSDFPELAGDPANLGIFAVAFDFGHDEGLVFESVESPDNAVYTPVTANAFTAFPGYLDEAEAIQSDFGVGGSAGAAEVEVYTLLFQVASSGLDAVDDSAATDSDQPVRVLVLENDQVNDSYAIQRLPASAEILTFNGVDGVNDPAVPANEVAGDSQLTIPSAAALSDLSIVSVTPGAGTAVVDDQGTADPADDEIVFTPAADFTGTANIVYRVTDGLPGGASDTATLTVAVSMPVRPAARDDRVHVAVGEELDLTAGAEGIYANDVATSGATLSLQGFTQPDQGSVTNPAGNQLLYLPPTSFEGTTSFTYTVNDSSGQGADSTATVTLLVGAPADSMTDAPGDGDETSGGDSGNDSSGTGGTLLDLVDTFWSSWRSLLTRSPWARIGGGSPRLASHLASVQHVVEQRLDTVEQIWAGARGVFEQSLAAPVLPALPADVAGLVESSPIYLGVQNVWADLNSQLEARRRAWEAQWHAQVAAVDAVWSGFADGYQGWAGLF